MPPSSLPVRRTPTAAAVVVAVAAATAYPFVSLPPCLRASASTGPCMLACKRAASGGRSLWGALPYTLATRVEMLATRAS